MLNVFFLYKKKKWLSATDNNSQDSPLPLSYLLPFSVQAEQADKAADLQQEINKNSQASKEWKRPDCRHVGQSSCRRQKSTTFISMWFRKILLPHFVTTLSIPFTQAPLFLKRVWKTNSYFPVSEYRESGGCLNVWLILPRKKATVSEKEERNMLGATSPRIRPIWSWSSSLAIRSSLWKKRKTQR